MKNDLKDIPWDSILSLDISKFGFQFVFCKNKYTVGWTWLNDKISKKEISLKGKPWINKNIPFLIRECNRLSKRYWQPFYKLYIDQSYWCWSRNIYVKTTLFVEFLSTFRKYSLLLTMIFFVKFDFYGIYGLANSWLKSFLTVNLQLSVRNDNLPKHS